MQSSTSVKIILFLTLLVGNEVSLVFSQCQGLGCLLQSGIIQSLVTVTVAKARMAKLKARQARMDAGLEDATAPLDPCESLARDAVPDSEDGSSGLESQNTSLIEQQCKREEKKKLYEAAREVAAKSRREAYLERKEQIQEIRAQRLREREERYKAIREQREKILEANRARFSKKKQMFNGEA